MVEIHRLLLSGGHEEADAESTPRTTYPGPQLAIALKEAGDAHVSRTSSDPSALLAKISLPFGGSRSGNWNSWRWKAIQ